MDSRELALIKAIPEDFLVEECLILPLEAGLAAGFQYFRLTKRGYTTFRAVEEIARAAGVGADGVTYAGLKDEDAVTRQHVAVAGEIAGPALDGFNEAFGRNAGGDSMSLSPLGYGGAPLQLGRLSGNSFRIILRRLEPAVAEQLAGRRHNHYFFNYFDTQRFGVPDGPKVAHRIGGALLRGDFEDALRHLVTGRSEEGLRAQSWTGSAEAFFVDLDPRMTTLYLNAAGSHDFNDCLAELVDACAGGDRYEEVRDGLVFHFAATATALLTALHTTDLAYSKYRASGSEIRHTVSRRPTVLQAQVEAGAAEPDVLHPGYQQCEMVFFLSPGSYATTAVSQLLGRVVSAGPRHATPSRSGGRSPACDGQPLLGGGDRE